MWMASKWAVGTKYRGEEYVLASPTQWSESLHASN